MPTRPRPYEPARQLEARVEKLADTLTAIFTGDGPLARHFALVGPRRHTSPDPEVLCSSREQVDNDLDARRQLLHLHHLTRSIQQLLNGHHDKPQIMAASQDLIGPYLKQVSQDVSLATLAHHADVSPQQLSKYASGLAAPTKGRAVERLRAVTSLGISDLEPGQGVTRVDASEFTGRAARAVDTDADGTSPASWLEELHERVWAALNDTAELDLVARQARERVAAALDAGMLSDVHALLLADLAENPLLLDHLNALLNSASWIADLRGGEEG